MAEVEHQIKVELHSKQIYIRKKKNLDDLKLLMRFVFYEVYRFSCWTICNNVITETAQLNTW